MDVRISVQDEAKGSADLEKCGSRFSSRIHDFPDTGRWLRVQC